MCDDFVTCFHVLLKQILMAAPGVPRLDDMTSQDARAYVADRFAVVQHLDDWEPALEYLQVSCWPGHGLYHAWQRAGVALTELRLLWEEQGFPMRSTMRDIASQWHVPDEFWERATEARAPSTFYTAVRFFLEDRTQRLSTYGPRLIRFIDSGPEKGRARQAAISVIFCDWSEAEAARVHRVTEVVLRCELEICLFARRYPVRRYELWGYYTHLLSLRVLRAPAPPPGPPPAPLPAGQPAPAAGPPQHQPVGGLVVFGPVGPPAAQDD